MVVESVSSDGGTLGYYVREVGLENGSASLGTLYASSAFGVAALAT